jgi:hypothetical protein
MLASSPTFRMQRRTSEVHELPTNETFGQVTRPVSEGGRIEIDMANETAATHASDSHGPIQYALLSAFIPGAGQVAQGRWVAGAVQFGVVIACLAGIFAAGPIQALWLALFWNAYSAVEAYWYERG